MVTQMFESQIRRNMEAYIDDMEVKSRQVGEHLADLGETFSVLREYKLRLNASHMEGFSMDRGVCNNFQGPQTILVQSTNTFQAR